MGRSRSRVSAVLSIDPGSDNLPFSFLNLPLRVWRPPESQVSSPQSTKLGRYLMRAFLSRLIAFGFFCFAATALFLIGSTGLVTSAYAAGACKDGTVASYIGTSCSQGNTTFNWNSYTCTSTPQSICDGLGTKGANLKIRLDPKGPHTLLLGATRLWNVTAGQNVDVVIKGTVAGATTNQNWPHFVGMRGQPETARKTTRPPSTAPRMAPARMDRTVSATSYHRKREVSQLHRAEENRSLSLGANHLRPGNARQSLRHDHRS